MNQNSKIISIIVPIYNSEKYLERCINSILNQTYTNFELILINDGSKDSSLKICRKYASKDNRIVVIDKENEGVSIARNMGIQRAKGELISFVDADDYIEKTFLEDMLNVMSKYNVDYVTCGYNRVYDDHTEHINNDLSEICMTSYEYLNNLLNVQKGYGLSLIHI